jgi:hypothetical protein
MYATHKVSSIHLKDTNLKLVISDIQVGKNSQLACAGPFDARLLNQIQDLQIDNVPEGVYLAVRYLYGALGAERLEHFDGLRICSFSPLHKGKSSAPFAVKFTKLDVDPTLPPTARPASWSKRRYFLPLLPTEQDKFSYDDDRTVPPGGKDEWVATTQVVGHLREMHILPQLMGLDFTIGKHAFDFYHGVVVEGSHEPIKPAIKDGNKIVFPPETLINIGDRVHVSVTNTSEATISPRSVVLIIEATL